VAAYLTVLGYTALLALLSIGAGALVVPRPAPGEMSPLELGGLRLACGMALVPILLILLYETAGLPVRLPVALLPGVAGLALLSVRARDRGGVGKLGNGDLALLLLSLAVFFACLRGSLRFPGFEGRDPWGHALGIRYLMEVGELRQPDPGFPQIQYVDAYPPLYDVLMSLPCRIAGSVVAPLKAANALVVGAVLVVFAALVRRLTGDRARSLCATVLYAALPGNLTRHVWSHSVAVLLLLAGLTAALAVRESRRWLLPGALCFGGGLLAAPSQGLVSGTLLAVTVLVALAISRGFAARLLGMGALAVAVALIWYGPMLARYGTDPAVLAAAMQHPDLRRTGATGKALAAGSPEVESPFAGNAPRRYNFDDFLFFRPYRFVLERLGAKQTNDIVPEGVGVPVFLLGLGFLAHLLLRRVRGGAPDWREVAGAWLLVSLAGLLGPYLGIKFFTWRFWLIVCPFACIAAADALLRLAASRGRALAGWLLAFAAADAVVALRADVAAGVWRTLAVNLPFLLVPVAAALWFHAERRTLPRAWLVGSVLAMHLIVAGPARLRVLTRYLPPKGFHDEVEHAGYLRIASDTPAGAAVFPLSGGARFEYLTGLDKTCRPYLAEERAFLRRHSRAEDPLPTAEVVGWLRAHGYRYLVLDPSYQAQDPALFARRAGELAGSARLVLHLRGEGTAASELFLYEVVSS